MRALAVAMCTAALLAGCTSDDGVTVAAASDMRPFLDDAVVAWEAQGGTPVTTVYAASGQLVQQWQQGAPYDILIVSDLTTLETSTRGEPAVVFGEGHLAVWSPDGALEIEDLAHVKRVAIANPDHAPFGRAAMEALTTSGMIEAVQPSLVYAQSVSQTLVLARTGEVGAAIVSAAQVNHHEAMTVNPDLYAPLCQAMALDDTAPVEAHLFAEFWFEFLDQRRDTGAPAPAPATRC